jgi:hypothetical protein
MLYVEKHFYGSSVVYEIMWKNKFDPDSHRRQYNMAHAHGMLDK